ncbi:hypothetical protein BDY19DRAFT_587586 [Irpex rosettiformis]|uniref:Uncharacterized protein n=1 Tax=Irpex rosettiformis TaxID=378272 RepID=A0ACB8UD15_9APHY|nr:hypothetical protein BDY19DRAFT_587586 [Irpex rosettiformis]
MPITVNRIRIFLYVVLFLFSAVLLGLTAARLHYTLHVPEGDPVNGGNDFYDPIVVELLVSSVLTLLWVPWVIHVIAKTSDYGWVSTFAGETVSLFIFFVMWLVGSAVSTHSWGDLSWCHIYRPCRILTAMVAFSWMGFILIFILLITNLMFAIANHAFRQPLHGRYDPRASGYGHNMTQYQA